MATIKCDAYPEGESKNAYLKLKDQIDSDAAKMCAKNSKDKLFEACKHHPDIFIKPGEKACFEIFQEKFCYDRYETAFQEACNLVREHGADVVFKRPNIRSEISDKLIKREEPAKTVDKQFEDGSVEKYLNGQIKKGVLEKEMTVGKYTYLGGSEIEFYEDGRVKMGELAFDQIVDDVLAQGSTKVKFDKEGMWSVLCFAYDNKCDGRLEIPMFAHVVRENGRIKGFYILKSKIMNGKKYSPNTFIKVDFCNIVSSKKMSKKEFERKFLVF